jgi:hypothetical protein
LNTQDSLSLGKSWIVMKRKWTPLTTGAIFALTALIFPWGVQVMAADGLTTYEAATAEGHDEQDRGRGEGKGLVGLCPYR